MRNRGQATGIQGLGQVGKTQTRVRKTSRKSVKTGFHVRVTKEEVVVTTAQEERQLLIAPPAGALWVFPKSGHRNMLSRSVGVKQTAVECSDLTARVFGWMQ